MNKQELIESISHLPSDCSRPRPMIDKLTTLELIKLLDGVEKEKRYEVILSNGQSLKTVYRQGEDRLDFEKVYGDLERFTRKQLEDAGLAWVFDCPGVKVKEVE